MAEMSSAEGPGWGPAATTALWARVPRALPNQQRVEMKKLCSTGKKNTKKQCFKWRSMLVLLAITTAGAKWML